MAESGYSFTDGRKPLNVIIIGGSCAGLFAGILLKRQGHNVHILEVAKSNEREGLAAGLGLAAKVKKFFDENDRLKEIPFGTTNEFMEITDWYMNTKSKYPTFYRMTTWDATYYRLRANFDAYRSPYCDQPPPPQESEGEGVFETSRRVIAVDGLAAGVEVVAEDVETNERKTYTADIVIAADGCNSTVRRQLQPALEREEPGYVLWRGTVPTKHLSKKLLDRIENRTMLYRMRRSYAIIYTIPGVNGSLKDGEREINFAWYFWVSRSELSEILTDISGHRHGTTLPKGQMRPEIWQKQLEHARRMFHPDLVELVEKIQEPFVSIISSISSKQAAFFNNRLFLIGDALTQKQPNSAQGVNFAASDAISCVDMICGKISPEKWEQEVLENGDRERLRSIAFGSWYLNSWFGIAFYNLRYRWMMWSQRWAKWWYGVAYPGVR